MSSAHTLDAGHRLADMLHVAITLHYGAEEFLTFDLNQKKRAEAEGLVFPVRARAGAISVTAIVDLQ